MIFCGSRVSRVLAWAVFALCVTGCASATHDEIIVQTLDSPAAFTARVATMLRERLPGKNVEVQSDLTLVVADAGQWNLDRIFAFCQRVPARCGAVAEGSVDRMVKLLRQQSHPVTIAQLRLLVRPEDTLENFPPNLHPLTKPLFDGLLLILASDQGSGYGYLQADVLGKLNLTEEKAFEIAANNTRASLQSTRNIAELRPGQLLPLSGGEDESGRLALHDDWAEYVARTHSTLLLAIPSSELAVVGNGFSQLDVRAVAAFVARAYATAERPISPDVFRWTPSGWEVAAGGMRSGVQIGQASQALSAPDRAGD
jgi:hypothetical protein